MKLMELDGSQGEGGGQILRTALTLSMITGTPFRVERIRAKRSKPGLLRQHLAAVQAAAEICTAEVAGAEPSSQVLEFRPGKIRGGDYRFAIGTAGSCTLLLQTVLPALWFADRASTVQVSGGTHNPFAPPADFLTHAWMPLVQRMGAEMGIAVVRHGFYPAGGGEVHASTQPINKLLPLNLPQRGKPVSIKAIAVVAGVPLDVARRELAQMETRLGLMQQEIRQLSSNEGPGNVVMLELQYEQLGEAFVAFGERGVSAEKVADQVVRQARQYLTHSAAVGEHLADQLVLPLALAGKGSFTTAALSSHLKTNLEIIQKFLPVKFDIAAIDGIQQIGVNLRT